MDFLLPVGVGAVGVREPRHSKIQGRDVPGGTVEKNLPACAGGLISEAIATDINGLQICHLHDIDATVGKTGNTLRTNGLHGYHVGGNKG